MTRIWRLGAVRTEAFGPQPWDPLTAFEPAFADLPDRTCD
jgi:hypothetical protein